MIEVEPIIDTQMIRINGYASEPKTASIIAKTWADEYINYNAHARHDSTVAAVNFLREKLRAVKDRVEQSERDAVEFARENPHVLLAAEGRNLLLDRLSSLHGRMASIEAQMDQSFFQAGAPATAGTIPETEKSPAMIQLEAEKVQLERDLAN